MDSLSIGALNIPPAVGWGLFVAVVAVAGGYALYVLGCAMRMVGKHERRLMQPPGPPPTPEYQRMNAKAELADMLAGIVVLRVTNKLLEVVKANRDKSEDGRYVFILTVGRIESLALSIMYAQGGWHAKPIEVDKDGRLVSFHDARIVESPEDTLIGVGIEPRVERVEV